MFCVLFLCTEPTGVIGEVGTCSYLVLIPYKPGLAALGVRCAGLWVILTPGCRLAYSSMCCCPDFDRLSTTSSQHVQWHTSEGDGGAWWIGWLYCVWLLLPHVIG